MREAGRASLQQANDMIRFADVKAAAVLAAAGVLAARLPSVDGSWASSTLIITGVCVLVLSALLALYTLAPQREATADWSLHYHGSIARRYGDHREAFIEAWLAEAADPGATERAVAGQIWAANMIAYRKVTRITWSIRALVIGVVVFAAGTLT
jgi:hypothetical protein